MVKVIVAGSAGRMGVRLIALVRDTEGLTLVGAVERPGHAAIGMDVGERAGCGRVDVPIVDDLAQVLPHGDVVVDFSAPSATLAHARLAAAHGRAMVIGTTGLTPNDLTQLQGVCRQIPCVFSPNMSVGINLLLKVLAHMAQTLGDDYDIEVVEAHHRLKKDAPSGTALKIAEVVARATNRDLEHVAVFARNGLIGERKPHEIGIQTIRAGDIVGDHTVLFGGMGERIEVTHRAQSRDTFARGALRAARWVVTQPPGLYDMAHVLGLG